MTADLRRALRDAAWRYAEDCVTPHPVDACERASLGKLRAALAALEAHDQTAVGGDECERRDGAAAAAKARVGADVAPADVAAPLADGGQGHDGEGSTLTGVGPSGEWPEGLLGVAMRVGETTVEADPDDGSCRELVSAPWADVATRDGETIRVALRQPVERLAMVWASDVVEVAR